MQNQIETRRPHEETVCVKLNRDLKTARAIVPFTGDGVLGILTTYLNEMSAIVEMIDGKPRRPTDQGLSAALIAFQVGLNKQLSVRRN